MRVLLPYPSFAHSVACLDRVRLGNQRSDCAVILAALTPGSGMPQALLDQPQVSMWAGYESALAVYWQLCCEEWAARGYAGRTVGPYREDWTLRPWALGKGLRASGREAPAPEWLGDERLHLSHQRSLMAILPEHYRDLGWRVAPKVDYWWPGKEKA